MTEHSQASVAADMGHEAQKSQQSLPDPKAILNSLGEVIYDWVLATDAITWGPNAAEVFGLADLASISTGSGFSAYLAPESPSSRLEAMTKTSKQDAGSGVSYEVTYGLTFGGTKSPVMWVEDTGRWFAGPSGRPARAHGIIRVVTEKFEAARQTSDYAKTDSLTGAASRPHFIEHASRRLAASSAKEPVAVLIVWLENIGPLNQKHGHAVGDELIATAASKIRAHMRASDVIGRYDGNKFALLLEACDEERMAIAAARFLAAVEEAPLQTSAGPISVSIRIGGVAASAYGRNPTSVLHLAESALDAARRSGSSHYIAYAPNLSQLAPADPRHLSLEIISALDQHRVVLAMQPIVGAQSRKTHFFEGLMRIREKDGRLTDPTTIIPIAEKTGLIRLIDQRMLELAAAELARDPHLRLTINASGETIHQPRWSDNFAALAEKYPGIAPRLTVEITETCAMSDLEATRTLLKTVKALGFKTAMDDFGAGNTSFRNLRALDIDLLKIDGAFVQNLARSTDDRFFVRTLLDLAQHLAISTVAEWVEDAETASILGDWGVDYLQGFYFGKPVVVEDRNLGATRAIA